MIQIEITTVTGSTDGIKVIVIIYIDILLTFEPRLEVAESKQQQSTKHNPSDVPDKTTIQNKIEVSDITLQDCK